MHLQLMHLDHSAGKWHSSYSGPPSAVWHDAGMQPDGNSGPDCWSADLPSRPDGASLHHARIPVVGGGHCCTLPASQWVQACLFVCINRRTSLGVYFYPTNSAQDTERKKSWCCRAKFTCSLVQCQREGVKSQGELDWLTSKHWRSGS